jgi:predicted RNA binding protein YcfA (HicA-like mRNA interferase family)
MTADGFSAMKGRKVLKVLRSLGYKEIPGGKGSHKKLACDGRPQLTFACHQGDEVSARTVRRILVQQVGLTPAEALEAINDV